MFTYVYTEMDKMEKAASSEVDNFDICEKDHPEAFVVWKRVAIGCEGY